MEKNTNQGFIAQAKDYVSDKFVAAKEAVGFTPEHPQGKVEHDRPFLNDIAKGNVESLHHVTPVEKDLSEYLGQDKCKVQIKKVDRQPFLNEVKDGVPLSHVETEDKSKPVIEEGVTIKNTGEQREQLLSDVEQFKRNNLNPVNTNDKTAPKIPQTGDFSHVQPAPSMFTQAKEFVVGAFDQVKQAITPSQDTIQQTNRTVEQTKEYVSDTLDNVKQQATQAQDFVAEKYEETKQIVMNDTKSTYAQTKEYVADKFQQAKEAVGFSPEHPQAKVEHDKPFLNDIAKGNVESLHHVTPLEKDLSDILGQDNVQIKKVDRQPFLNEVKDGVPLSHVETQDKSLPIIDQDVTIKNIGEQRQQLLNDVEGFARKNNLQHVNTVDKSVPQLTGNQ